MTGLLENNATTSNASVSWHVLWINRKWTMERNGLPHVVLEGFSVDIVQTLDYIFVCRWGTADMLCASRPVRCILAACNKVCAQLTKSFCGIHAQWHWLAHKILWFFFCLHIAAAQTHFFCIARIQQSTKWNSFLAKTTYTSCRLLHRSTRVATVTLCLCAAVAGLQRTSGGPCFARQRRTFTAGGDLYAKVWVVRPKDGNKFTKKETFNWENKGWDR